MNPGKAMAQAAHAANAAQTEITSRPFHPHRNAFQHWREQGYGAFGTTIVLGVTEAEMHAAVDSAQSRHIHAKVIMDESYPFGDGTTAPVNTCAFVFCPGACHPVRDTLNHLTLHP